MRKIPPTWITLLLVTMIVFSLGAKPKFTAAHGLPNEPTAPPPSEDSATLDPVYERRWDGDGNPFAVMLKDDRFLEEGLLTLQGPRFPLLSDDLPPQEGYSGPFTATAVTTGYSYSCALTNTGAVKCWGDNTHGKLGDGTTTNRLTPVNVVGLSSGVIAISSSHKHTCALTSEGGVKCWGYNLHGELGDGTTQHRTTPVDVVGLSSGVVAISAGGFHTCALTNSGAVKCWGANWHGQVGDGSTAHRSTPVSVDSMTWGVKAISAGKYHTCGIDSSGAVKCWGYNKFGQLGDGTNVQKTRPVNVVGARRDIAAIAVGALHSCLITTRGAAKCWGENSQGQIGDDTKLDRWTPVEVSGLESGVTAMSGGGYFTCARYGDSSLKCWGANWAGQIGDGTTLRRKTPVDVVGLSGAINSLDTGDSHSCVTTSHGQVMCWGWNAFGQVGNGTSALRLTPVSVFGLASGMTHIASGGMHTCGITAQGGVLCWGNNQYGQLGDGTIVDKIQPVSVIGLSSGIVAITAGGFHTCALDQAGKVKCWGFNRYGQLGDGSQTHSRIPVDVENLGFTITTISAGNNHTCATSADGRAFCWGDNFAGQLGDGTREEKPTPVRVKDLNGLVVTHISAGETHTCALLDTGGVKCWGNNNYGKLGDGTTNNRQAPVNVVGLSSGVVAISVGMDHSCALTSTGGIKCWGSNVFGQLGNGSGAQSYVPTDVTGLGSGNTALSAGGYHTCAIQEGGSVKCWGDNWTGQIGDGTTISRPTPTDVVGLLDQAIFLSAGAYHTCTVTDTGGAKCWGMNGNGQIGDATLPWQVTPMAVANLEAAVLSINYGYGRPGSYFTIKGVNFPPGEAVTVVVNEQVLSPVVPVDDTGNFTFLLNTAAAGIGHYGVTVRSTAVMPGATTFWPDSIQSTGFSLIAGAVLRLQEDNGPILDVPAGIGYTNFLYFPIRNR